MERQMQAMVWKMVLVLEIRIVVATKRMKAVTIPRRGGGMWEVGWVIMGILALV